VRSAATAQSPLAPLTAQTAPANFFRDRFAGTTTFAKGWRTAATELATLYDYTQKDSGAFGYAQGTGAFAAGNLSQEDYDGIEHHACPTVGACGGMFTANTMSSSFEALGMSLLGSSQMASPDAEKANSAAASAAFPSRLRALPQLKWAWA